MTLTLILVASVTINIILLLLVNYFSKKRAEIYLSSWKVKEEKKIRSDAHSRRRAVGWGKTIEKFVPWMKGFPCDPRDSIFLAKPIDYLCFTDRRNKKKSAVHFIEVKSGDANLSHDQEGIKEAIKKNRVFWHEVIVDGYLDNGKNVITKTQKNNKKPKK